MENIVGIDLGTTNCSITAIDENGKTRLIKNKHGEYITPSAVYFGKDKSNLLIGKEAKQMSNTDPDNLVLFVKREMGKKVSIKIPYCFLFLFLKIAFLFYHILNY